MISRYKIKIVVLACNTATTSAINYLRKTFFDIFFIGTEPAIKVAFDKNYKKILSIATPTTIIQDKYLKLIKNTDTYIKSIALDEFAKTIEDYLIKTSLKNKYHLLKEIFKIKKLSINFDAIVLGCTHYVIIKDLLKKYINIPLIDGNFGIAKMVCNQFSKTKISKERLLYLEKYLRALKKIRIIVKLKLIVF